MSTHRILCRASALVSVMSRTFSHESNHPWRVQNGKRHSNLARSLDDWTIATGPIRKWHGSRMAESALRGRDASVQGQHGAEFSSGQPPGQKPAANRL